MTRSYAEYVMSRVREIDEIGDEIYRLRKLGTDIKGAENLVNGLQEVWADLGTVTFRLVNSVTADYPELGPDVDRK